MQIDDAREFIKFLHGAVPWNGTWFGEYAPGERGAYWWRKHLDEAIAALIAAPAAPQQAEPCDVCDVCNALTVPRNATRYDADDLKAAQVRGKIIAARLQQQAEPVAQIGWSEEFGNRFPNSSAQPICATGSACCCSLAAMIVPRT